MPITTVPPRSPHLLEPTPKAEAKFIQIAVAADEAGDMPYLYALDESGDVWYREVHADEWVRLSMRRARFSPLDDATRVSTQ